MSQCLERYQKLTSIIFLDVLPMFISRKKDVTGNQRGQGNLESFLVMGRVRTVSGTQAVINSPFQNISSSMRQCIQPNPTRIPKISKQKKKNTAWMLSTSMKRKILMIKCLERNSKQTPPNQLLKRQPKVLMNMGANCTVNLLDISLNQISMNPTQPERECTMRIFRR